MIMQYLTARTSLYVIIRHIAIVPTMLVDKAFQIDSITFYQFKIFREIPLIRFWSDLWILYHILYFVLVFLVVMAPM